MAIIYKITNKLNNMAYIGLTKQTLDSRWMKHINTAKNPKTFFHKAIHKYGVENFSLEILETVDIEKLEEREIFWIKEYDTFINGYNLTSGGELKKEISEKTKKIWSIQRKGNKFRLGCKRSEESKLKQSNSRKGITFSEEWKENHSKRMSGEGNPCFGKKFKWINNGFKNKRLYTEDLPKGWVIGYVSKAKSQNQ